MSSSFPCVATVVAWRNEMGHVRSTLVGKITVGFGPGGALQIVAPTPLVLHDRETPDGRYLLEATDCAPWCPRASVLLRGGPAKLTLASGATSLVATAIAGAPVGYARNAPERVRFAPERPVRGGDGRESYPDSLDPRFFLAAPFVQQLDALRGDEAFTLENGGQPIRGALPGLVVVATAEVDGRVRALALALDTLLADAAARTISLVGRAAVEGAATLLSFAALPLAKLSSPDRGDALFPRPTTAATPDKWLFGAPAADLAFDETSLNQTAVMGDIDSVRAALRAAPVDQTADVSATDLAALRPSSTPFVESSTGFRGMAPPVPATPFDRGFAPAEVIPAAAVATTLSPDEEMAQKLAEMRAQLRGQKKP